MDCQSVKFQVSTKAPGVRVPRLAAAKTSCQCLAVRPISVRNIRNFCQLTKCQSEARAVSIDFVSLSFVSFQTVIVEHPRRSPRVTRSIVSRDKSWHVASSSWPHAAPSPELRELWPVAAQHPVRHHGCHQSPNNI